MIVILAILLSTTVLSLFCWLLVQAVRAEGRALLYSANPELPPQDLHNSSSGEVPALQWARQEVRYQERRLREAELEARRSKSGRRSPASDARATLRVARGEVRTRRAALNGPMAPRERRKRQAALQEAVKLEKAARSALKRAPLSRTPEPDIERAVAAADQEVRMRRKALKDPPSWHEQRDQRAALREARQRRDDLQQAAQAQAAEWAVQQSRAALRRAVDQNTMLRGLTGQQSQPTSRPHIPPLPSRVDDARTARREWMPVLLYILALTLPIAERRGQLEEWRADLWYLAERGGQSWRRWRYALTISATVPRLAARRFRRIGK